MKEAIIRKEYNLKENEIYMQILHFHNSIQKKNSKKLNETEMKLASTLMEWNDENPFKGSERRKLMSKLNLSSQNLAMYTKALVDKGMLIKAGSRGIYKIHPHYEKIRRLVKKDIAIKYEFLLELDEGNI